MLLLSCIVLSWHLAALLFHCAAFQTVFISRAVRIVPSMSLAATKGVAMLLLSAIVLS